MMGVLTEPKIDAHCHVLDPAKFPYNPDVAYHPAGQEMGKAEYFLQLMACYEVKHALLVHPLDQLGGAIGRLPVFDKETRQTRCVEVEQVGASGRDGLGHGR